MCCHCVRARMDDAGVAPAALSARSCQCHSFIMTTQIVRYAKAATAVQGCSYKLEGRVRPGQLPFVGPATAEQISDIIRTGTCDALVKFR